MDALQALSAATAELDQRLAAVAPDQWHLPTPCEGWDVRQLVHHVVGGNAMAALITRGASADEGSAAFALDLGDDPLGAYRATAANQEDALNEPGALERTVHHPALDMPGSMLLGFRTADLLVHGWDLARATGQDEALHPGVAEVAWAFSEPLAPIIAGSGMFGPGASGTLPGDAPLDARLLDLLGRRP